MTEINIALNLLTLLLATNLILKPANFKFYTLGVVLFVLGATLLFKNVKLLFGL